MLTPVLSALTELLTGPATEEFKKLLKPSALVASAIFLTLNLVLILPVLRELGAGPVITLERLSTAWQIALGTLLLFAMAYVLNSLGGAFLALASGSALRDSPLIGQVLLGLQTQRYERLLTRAKGEQAETQGETNKEREKQEKALATLRLATEFPDKGALAPTRLGNALASASAHIQTQYGAHLNTVWPFMDLVLQKEDSTLRDQLNENRDALAFLTTLSSLLGLVAVELALVNLAARHPWRALWALALVAVAYVAYGAAILKARAWRTDVCSAFELYLDKVGERLDLIALEPHEWKTARERWQEVSEWLAYGGSNLEARDKAIISYEVEPKTGWYKPPAPSIRLAHPDTVTVTRLLEALEFSTDKKPSTGTNAWEYKHTYSYRYAISNPATGEFARPAQGVYLTVTDTRVPSDPREIEGTLTAPRHYGAPTAPTTQIQPEPNQTSATLLWYIGRVDPQVCRILQYKIGCLQARVSVSSGALKVTKVSEPGTGGMVIEFAKTSKVNRAEIEIELLNGKKVARAVLYQPDSTPKRAPIRTGSAAVIPNRWTLTLDSVPSAERFTIGVAFA